MTFLLTAKEAISRVLSINNIDIELISPPEAIRLEEIIRNATTGGYQGTWNATANEPDIANSSPAKGYWYIVSVAGNTSVDGISTWGVNDVAIFNGTAWERIANAAQFSQVIIVQEFDDFGTSISTDKLYFIDGEIDCGTNQIEVPAGGIYVKGHGFNISKMYSTSNNFTMFTSASGGAGDVFFENIVFETPGTNSRVFDLTDVNGFNAVEMDSVNFENCSEVGNLRGYRQGLERNTGRFGCSGGLNFYGTALGGYRTSVCIVRNQLGGTVFKADTSYKVYTRWISDINMQVPSGCTGFYFTEDNIVTDEGLELVGARFSGSTSGTGVFLDGINGTSTKVRISETKGILNTYVGAYWDISTEVVTTFSGISTPTKLLGTTTFAGSWISKGGTDNNATVVTSQPILVEVDFNGSFSSGNNKNFTLFAKHWDDSLSSYSDINSTTFTTNGGSGGTKAENVTLISKNIEVHENDRIEVWVQNNSGTEDLTCLEGSHFKIKEIRS